MVHVIPCVLRFRAEPQVILSVAFVAVFQLCYPPVAVCAEAAEETLSALRNVSDIRRAFILRKDGSLFDIHPVLQKESPLDVKGVDLDHTAGEIVDIVREIGRSEGGMPSDPQAEHS